MGLKPMLVGATRGALSFGAIGFEIGQQLFEKNTKNYFDRKSRIRANQSYKSR